MKNKFFENFASSKLDHQRFKRGLSLVECALAVLIAGTAIMTVLEISTNTISTAIESSQNRIASLLASEIMSVECASVYEMSDSPHADGEKTESGEKEVDTERFGDMYKGFSYNVIKTYEEIDIETELSDDAQEDDPYNYDDEDEEELPVVKVVRVRVEIFFPQERNEEERGKLVLETYVTPNSVNLDSEGESSD